MVTGRTDCEKSSATSAFTVTPCLHNGVMLVAEIEAALAEAVSQLNPDDVPVQSVVKLFERLDRIERLAATGKTLLARRVDESAAWKRFGYANAAEYLAAKAGSSVAAARDVLSTSEKLGSVPVVEDAMRAGKLSGSQATVVVDAAAAAPREQARLVNEAQRSSLNELRDTCQKTKAAADPDPEATHERIHNNRRLRTFTDREGAWNLVARGTVADGAKIEAALKPLIDARFEKARAAQRREPREAYAFDALIDAVDRPSAADASNPRLRYLGLIRVDLEALRRGIAEQGELCELTGIGPVPVSTARDMLGEAILKLVITKGVDVLHVTHLGRGPSVAQKVALLWESPICIVEGCFKTRVEIDHNYGFEWAKTHHTRLDELEPKCDDHHDLSTYHGWALVEGSGKRKLVPPDHPDHPRNKPPPD